MPDEPKLTHAQKQASNQRTELRHKVFVHVISVAGGKVDHQGLSGNLSRNGLFVATPTLVPVGTAVTLRFRLPNDDQPITAVAEVAWTREQRDFAAGIVPGYGVKFVELEEEDQQALDRYMDHFDSGSADVPGLK